jgi:2-hydroxy-3-oxopropionate reductase
MVGTRFTEKLLGAGWPVTVYDIDREKLEAAARLGVTAAASARDVADRSDVVLLCLPGSPPVEEAMNGPDGILAAVTDRHMIIDTGTTRPATDIEYAAKVRERGGRMVDAPITGRPPGYIIMVGGSEKEFSEAKPVLQVVGYRVCHVGPLGHGQRLKLVNQLILAGRLSVLCEAVSLARGLGLDPEQIASVLEFDDAKRLLARRFSVPGSQLLALHTKDLEYLAELIEQHGLHAPLTKLVTGIFQETRGRSEPDWAQTAVMTHWEKS